MNINNDFKFTPKNSAIIICVAIFSFGGASFLLSPKSYPIVAYEDLNISSGVLKYELGYSWRSGSPYLVVEGQKQRYACVGSGQYGVVSCSAKGMANYINKPARIWWFETCGTKYIMQVEVKGNIVATYNKYKKLYEQLTYSAPCM